MKQYTTPTIVITIAGAEDLLASARKVIVTFAKGNVNFDIVPIISGDKVLATLTQTQTAAFTGNVQVEVTIVDEDGRVLKTKTLEANVEKSVKKKAIMVN